MNLTAWEFLKLFVGSILTGVVVALVVWVLLWLVNLIFEVASPQSVRKAAVVCGALAALASIFWGL